MKISIITINFNNHIGLEKTINSVVCQTYSNIEYIIIDGGSTDESVEIIKNHINKVSYYVSENDEGIYDAMNKGIKASNGEYCLFLNSGDTLANNTVINSVVNGIKGYRFDIIYGDLIVVDNLGNEKVKKYSDELSFEYFNFETLPHPSTLIRKKIFDKLGVYDSSLKIVADWKLFLIAICKHNCSYKHFDIAISKFKTDGLSSIKENEELIRNEKKLVLKTEFPYFINLYQELKEFKHLYVNVKNSRRVRFLKKLKIL